jgi:hypothetical protein
MKYCVIKNTTKVIDGSNNPDSIMLQNAVNAGFTEAEVEILTEAEYEAREALEPVPSQPPTAEERIEALELAMLEVVLGG